MAGPPVGKAVEILILSGPASYEGLVPRRDDGGETECLLDERLGDRRIWVVRHTIPGPSGADMEAYRRQIHETVRALPNAPQLSPAARAAATMTGEDGLVGWADFAVYAG